MRTIEHQHVRQLRDRTESERGGLPSFLRYSSRQVESNRGRNHFVRVAPQLDRDVRGYVIKPDTDPIGRRNAGRRQATGQIRAWHQHKLRYWQEAQRALRIAAREDRIDGARKVRRPVDWDRATKLGDDDDRAIVVRFTAAEFLRGDGRAADAASPLPDANDTIEREATSAQEFFRKCPGCLLSAEKAYAAAHEGMPTGDPPPESVIVVNLPPIVPALLAESESPTLAPVADDEL